MGTRHPVWILCKSSTLLTSQSSVPLGTCPLVFCEFSLLDHFWFSEGGGLDAKSSRQRHQYFLILFGWEGGNTSTGNLRGQSHRINITFDHTTCLCFKHTCGFLHSEAVVEQGRTLPEGSSYSVSHCPQVCKTQRPTNRPLREAITPNNIRSFLLVLSGDLQTDVFITF